MTEYMKNNAKEIRRLFLLEETINFLNFGSFGACPTPVFEDHLKWQRLLEKEPVRFIVENGPKFLEESKHALGSYIGATASDLIFVPNPTFAINILAKNLLKQDDEVLTTDLEYGAMDYTWQYHCEKAGAHYVKQHISLPLTSKENFIEEFWKGFTTKTRIVFISHITSSTGLIFPVEEICAEAKLRGLITIVDGAHVPGHIPLNLQNLNADFYTGACHKWMMAPKGCSFLYASKDFQNTLDPLIISWGFKSQNPIASQFQEYHQYNGTRDFSAYLCIPAVLKFREDHHWDVLLKNCKASVLKKGAELSAFLGTAALAPLSSEFYGQLYAAEIQTSYPEELQRMLYTNYGIEIPVMRHGDRCYIRFSFQPFNQEEEIDALISALEEIRTSTDLWTKDNA
jgi:isopenicillin-N epimerase